MATASSAALVRTSVVPVSLGSRAQNPPSTTMVKRSITTVPSDTPRLERLRRLMESLLHSIGIKKTNVRQSEPAGHEGLDQWMKQ